jgi:hypothetical protein
LSAVHDRLFNIFTATLHIGGCSSLRSLSKCHAMLTGTHLSRPLPHTSSYNAQGQLYFSKRQSNKIKLQYAILCGRLNIPFEYVSELEYFYDMFTDIIFYTGMNSAVRLHSKRGATVYYYSFEYRGSNSFISLLTNSTVDIGECLQFV